MKVEPSIMHDYIVPIVLGAVTSVGGFIVWVGRIIFTNNKRIDALEKDHKHARELRVKQDEMVQEIRTDQKKLIEHILKTKD